MNDNWKFASVQKKLIRIPLVIEVSDSFNISSKKFLNNHQSHRVKYYHNGTHLAGPIEIYNRKGTS